LNVSVRGSGVPDLVFVSNNSSMNAFAATITLLKQSNTVAAAALSPAALS
jgi:hypothetical protein